MRRGIIEIVTTAEALAGWSGSDFEWIELENRSPVVTLDLTDVRFTQGVSVDIPAGTMLAPGARCLVVRSSAAFTMRHGTAARIVGEFATSRLDNGGEPLKLSYGGGVPIREFRYDDDTPWPTGARGTGFSISFLPSSSVDFQGDGAHWRSVPATPGGANVFPSGWDSWLRNYFNPSDAAFTAQSAPHVDPDGDGESNVVEYLLGSSPVSISSVGSLASGIVSLNGESFPTISFIARSDVTLTPEFSTNMTQWSGMTLVLVSNTLLADGTTRTTMRDTTAMSVGSRRYLRIRVARP